MSQRFLFAILLIVAFVFLALIYTLPVDPIIKFVFAIICLIFDVLAFTTKQYMDFFMPIIRAKNKTVVIDETEAFTLAPSGNAIVVRKGDQIFASAIVKIPTYRSSTEMAQEEKVDFSRLFSRALTLTRKPVKFGSQLYVINKDEYINNIRDKLNEVEDRYQNALVSKEISKKDSERIRGEVTMWHNLFDNVSRVKSQSLEAYAMLTSEGTTEEEAVNLALQQADEIAVGISALFGVTATLTEGQELLKFVEPDYMIPIVTVSEQLREKSIEQGI